MKRIFRKNQMIITALALLIAVAGYISYTQTRTDEMMTASTEEMAGAEETLLDLSEADLTEEIFTDTEDSEEAGDPDAGSTVLASAQKEDGGKTAEDVAAGKSEIAGKAETTGKSEESTSGEKVEGKSSEIASQMKLNREQTRSKNKETLLEIVNNEKLSDNQKEDAVKQLQEMIEVAEKESTAENLLLAKGFTDVVVNLTDDGADVVLNMGDVTEAKRAQVEDIVKRKTGVAAEQIVITPIKDK